MNRRRWVARISALGGLYLAACGTGDDDGMGLNSTSASVGGVETEASSSGGSGDSDPGTSTGSVSPTSASSSSSGGTQGSTESTGDPFGDASTGEPEPPPFEPGHVFVAAFSNRSVFEYDQDLNTVTSWVHPSFDAAEGPSGMVFDERGYLVVAGFDEFCVFSGPGEVETCHPKIQAQRTENIIFDINRNLYTTTSTGGTDEVHQYDEDYNHVTTFELPTGNLTGVTCDPNGDLFIASQTGVTSTVYKLASGTLDLLDTFSVPGNAEGMQFGQDGNLLVAGGSIARVTPASPSSVLETIDDPGLLFPVPLTTDAEGNIYTADFENGTGSVEADLFIFDAVGNLVASRQPSEIFGPFGMVVAGTSLPCGAVPPG